MCALLVYGVMYRAPGPHRLRVPAEPLARGWLGPAAAGRRPGDSRRLRRRDPTGALLLALVGCCTHRGGRAVRSTAARSCRWRSCSSWWRPRAPGRWRSPRSPPRWHCSWSQGFILTRPATALARRPASRLGLIIAWMIGISVQQRRSYTARVREQVATVAVTEERLRIARELHDVVAHSMTVVAVQAGFGEYVFDTDPAEARAALGNIQQVTREALSDMQRLLGVLRQDGTGQPGAAPGRRPAGCGAGRRRHQARAAAPARARPRPGRPGAAGVHHRGRGRPGQPDQDRRAVATSPPRSTSRRSASCRRR